jgi:spermidine synthase
MFTLFFFVSGFCGLLYQIVWLRLAMSFFGVIAPVLSVVLSVFMLGLGLGSWAMGRWMATSRVRTWDSRRLLMVYGICEGVAALGALAVPEIFSAVDSRLTGGMHGAGYFLGSALAIAAGLIVPCLALGATTPAALAFGRARGWDTRHGFSGLYTANVLGALCGAVLTPVLFIERLGFHKTLVLGFLLQLAVCISALLISLRSTSLKFREATPEDSSTGIPDGLAHRALGALFLTGFVSLACEVLWTRLFTCILGTTIYAFAGILAVYLWTHAIGATLYRRFGRKASARTFGWLLGSLSLAALLPLLLNDPRWPLSHFRALGSLMLFCGLLGWLTPAWVDAYSLGEPRRAGRAYAMNVLGCVLGPLVAGYILLPWLGIKASIMGLSLLLCGFALWTLYPKFPRAAVAQALITLAALVGTSLLYSIEVRTNTSLAQIRRDYAATVVSDGTGMYKRLSVNGINLTNLTPVTKMMAHLPILSHTGHPHRALMICFGMGTTYRSLLSWNLDTTAVELVPSVRDAFGYYFADAADVLRRPEGRIVIDDGRRFLKRTDQQYDIVTLDPPPPVECAASGLLYSREFYGQVKQHLAPNGVIQQWWPGGEVVILQSVTRTFVEAFPYVRIYRSLGGGFHLLGSRVPLRVLKKDELQRAPSVVQRDILEWFPQVPLQVLWDNVLKREINPEVILNPSVPTLTDDAPFNEYFLLRRLRASFRHEYSEAH